MKDLVCLFICRYIFAIAVFGVLVTFGSGQDFPLDTDNEGDLSVSSVFGIAIFAPSEDLFKVQKFVKEEVKPAIQAIRGVAKVSIPCEIKREVHVLLDPLLLEAYGLSLSQVASIIGTATDVSTNSLDFYANRALTTDGNEPQFLEEVGEIVIDSEYGLRVSDVGEVSSTSVGLAFSMKFNGDPAVLLEVQKLSDSNIIKIVAEVEKKLKNIKTPDGYEMQVVSTTVCHSVATDSSDLIYEETFLVDQARLVGTGLSVNDVFDAIKLYTVGIENGEILNNGEIIPIVTKIHPLFIQDEQAFLNLPIYAPSLQGNLPLGQLGSFKVRVDQ